MEAIPFVVTIPAQLSFDDDELLQFCAANRDLHIERDSSGEVIIMAPSGSETSSRNTDILADLAIWNRETGLGKVFGSSGGFVLPNGAMRAPDAAWLPSERWNKFSKAEREKFLPLCPDFVVELRSPSDRLKAVQEKMQEWMENGCRLGWLIDPVEEKAWIYRPEGEVEVVASFNEVLSGEDVLPGFELRLAALR